MEFSQARINYNHEYAKKLFYRSHFVRWTENLLKI